MTKFTHRGLLNMYAHTPAAKPLRAMLHALVILLPLLASISGWRR